MGLFSKLHPKELCGNAYEIDYEGWYKKGKRGILFDVDNTLVRDEYPANEKAMELMKRLRGIGFKLHIISNNSEGRVQPFAEAVGVPFVCHAKKPLPDKYTKCCEKMGLDKEKCLFVGDQMFTDILGANRAGIYSIMVKKIHPKEIIQIRLRRIPEAIVMLFYRNKEE